MLLVFSQRNGERTKKLLAILRKLIVERRRKDVTSTARNCEASV
jgi:hypothetical protein